MCGSKANIHRASSMQGGKHHQPVDSVSPAITCVSSVHSGDRLIPRDQNMQPQDERKGGYSLWKTWKTE